VTSAGRASAFTREPSCAASDRFCSEVAALGAGRCARARKGESARPRTENINDVALEMSGQNQRTLLRPRIRPAIGCDPGSGLRSDATPDPVGDRMRPPDPAGDRMRPRIRPAIGCDPDSGLHCNVASVEEITTFAKSFGSRSRRR